MLIIGKARNKEDSRITITLLSSDSYLCKRINALVTAAYYRFVSRTDRKELSAGVDCG